jgi:hypothetical protein
MVSFSVKKPKAFPFRRGFWFFSKLLYLVYSLQIIYFLTETTLNCMRISNFIIFWGLFLGFSNSAYAQNQKSSHNLSAGIGSTSTEAWQDATEDEVNELVKILTLGYHTAGIINRNYSPTWHLTYSRALSGRFLIGIGGAYEKASGDYQQNAQIVGSFRRQSYSVAAEGKYLYLNNNTVSCYGSLALGYTINRQHENKPKEWASINQARNHFNLQISPIGIRIGTNLGGFVELGYGYKGILNAGMNYRF